MIDYTREDLKARLKDLAPEGVEVVFEHPGAATFDLSVKALAQGGRLVTCGATTGPEVALDLRRLFMKQASLLGSTMGTRAELMAVLDEVAAGNLRVVVDRVLPALGDPRRPPGPGVRGALREDRPRAPA